MLLNALKGIDTKSKNMIHKDYLFDLLKSLGIPEMEIYEKKLVLQDVEQVDEQIYYMDFVDLVYPTGNKNSDSHISNVEDFIEQIKNDMRMR